jgi:hypothetical protein
LTVLAAIRPSRRILYPNSGSIEGRSAADGSDVSGGLEGVADVGPYGAQWQVRQRSVPARSTASGLLPQCPAWVCTCRGGRHAVDSGRDGAPSA